MPNTFEWDPSKNKLNIQKHHLSFEEAFGIFSQPVLTLADNRKDYGETRQISIGTLDQGIVIVVVHTDRNKHIRIISARIANKNERKKYYDYLKTAAR